MPRLFTGIKIPKDIAEVLILKRGNIPGARWVDSGDYHITLRFIGDIEESLAREVDLALGAIQHSRFHLRLESLDIFGAKRPRTLFARVQSNEPLDNLQAKHERAMQLLGLRPEGRKYAPHVTLARLRGTKPVALRNYLIGAGQFTPLVTPLEFEAEGFALFSARDSIGGGPYVMEEYYAFA